MSSPISIVLDATMLDTFMLCECKFNYRHNMNKVVPEKPKPLDQGGIIHIGQETYFSLLKASSREESYDVRVNASIEAMQHMWITESELDQKTFDTILAVFRESTKYWRERDERLEVLAVESPFIYELHSDDTMKLFMMGKIDLLVNEPGYFNLPYDHKSYSRSYPVRRLMNQFCNYAYATGSNYLIVNKIGFQETLKPSEKHKRIPVSYDPMVLSQWKDNVVLTAYKYLECQVTGKWPMNLTSCDKFNRECEYYPVCDSSGVEAKMYKLTANYNDAEPWDVSKVLGKKS